MNLPSKQMSIGLLHRMYAVVVTALMPVVASGLMMSQRGRRRLRERFGLWGHLGDIDWWLHGASVGEVQGVIPLIKTLRNSGMQARLLLTATSPTGLDRGAPLVDETRLLPIDSPVLVRNALARFQCKRLVISETELWPCLLKEAHDAQIPVHLINARISDYTYQWYRHTAALFRPLILRCASISVADTEQLEKFVSLGVPSAKVHVTGHTKYDIEPRYPTQQARDCARQDFFPGITHDTPLLVLGSLREGEDRVWFSAIKRARGLGLSLRVIVAPRHAERFSPFFARLQTLGVQVARWSQGVKGLQSGHEVLLLDTMGVLEQAYAASDMAFVGATLVDIGGHNPLEPAMYRVPVVVGPYTSVIKELVSEMRTRRGIVEIVTEDDALNVLLQLSTNRNDLHRIGQAGYEVYATHRGAVSRVQAVIQASEAGECLNSYQE